MFAHYIASRLHRCLWTATLVLCLTFASTAFAQDAAKDAPTDAPTCADDEIFDPLLDDCRYTFSIRYTSTATLPAMIEACEERESMIACASWSLWAWRRGGWDEVSERAGQLCEQRCTEGDPAGCGCLAHMIGTGSAGFERDIERGNTLAQQSCEGGVGWGCNMRRTLHNDTSDVDDEELLDEEMRGYERGCILGDPSSCANLGYFEGHLKRGEDSLTKSVARKRFLEGCEKYIGWACGAYGEMLYLGLGGEVQLEEGLAFVERGCELGDPMACENLGDIHLGHISAFQDSLPQDRRRALSYYEQGCGANWDRSCAWWALMVDTEFPDTATHTELERAYRVGCFRGRSEACLALGAHYRAGDDAWTRNLAEARAVFARDCRHNQSESCLHYGELLETGAGGPVDIEAALEAYQFVCKAGFSRGCEFAGALLMYNGPEGADPDHARLYFMTGCDNGVGSSCTWLGFWIQSYANSAPEMQQALQAYQRACDLDEPRGCIDLALLYERGSDHVEANPRLARSHFTKACRLEDRIACAHLGRYLRDGIGIEAPAWEAAADILTLTCTSEENMLTDSAQRGAALACRWLAQGYAEQGIDVLALEIARRGCDLRDPESCAHVAELMRTRTSGHAAQSAAAAYEAKACDYGELSSCSAAADAKQ